jgi:signal transduction histidine kinase
MSTTTRLNSRIIHLAVGRNLPHRAVRTRLTLLYGGLFLLSGATLMTIAYALLVNAGFVFTLQTGPGTARVTGPSVGVVRRERPPGGFPALGSTTHPSAQTMQYWRTVARCMRRQDVSRFPEPTTSVPANLRHIGNVSDRDGAILVFPPSINTQSAAFKQAASECGYIFDSSEQAAQASGRRTHAREELLIQSGIALAGMSLLSLGLGWLMAGRVLQPLEDSYRAQRQFVANASHELRAPLTRLRALSEVALASSDASVASLQRAHERVLASERRLEQLIDALLTLTRGQAGLERCEHLDLAILTSHAMLTHESEATSLNLDVRITLDTAPAAGDPRLLERLIDNLIDNAVRHNSICGQVEITTGTRDRRAFLTITNTGPNVPADQVQRLFQPFERLGGARNHHDGGHGLGLAIVHAITDAHRAELSAKACPDGGLAIEISFPRQTAPAPVAADWTKHGSRTRAPETDAPHERLNRP